MHLFELEKKLIDPKVRINREQLETLLAPDFFEFGCSGKVWTRETIVNALLNSPPVEVEAYDFKALDLAKDIVLVTYKTKKADPGGSAIVVLRSSIWKLHGEHWQLVFHQGTKTNP
jgi:hypothetical protein